MQRRSYTIRLVCEASPLSCFRPLSGNEPGFGLIFSLPAKLQIMTEKCQKSARSVAE